MHSTYFSDNFSMNYLILNQSGASALSASKLNLNKFEKANAPRDLTAVAIFPEGSLDWVIK